MIKKIFNIGDIRNGYPVLPKNERKNIIVLSDDLRLPSGVGTVTKEFVLGICHQFNIVQIGGAVKHPESGKIIDMCKSVQDETGVVDAYLKIYPTDGYGNQMLLRTIMDIEKPDIILHFTDPRFWGWLYQMEHEIRTKIPIAYLNIWDDVPFPHWNKPFYNSCDLLMGISKQTNIINRVVLGEDAKDKIITYVPHGINEEVFHPISENDIEYQKILLTKQNLFGVDNEKDFVLFYNSRNIRRKMTSDIILAYKVFCDKLPKEKADKCALVLHTQPVDENGTDLPAVVKAICPEYDVIFSTSHINSPDLNILYNIADVTINLSSNEGFGLGTAESLMAGTPIIVNVTGGLQDQCGFIKDDGSYVTIDDLSSEWATNHDGRYKKHGEWVKPVWPKTRSIQGSIPTPFIFDDRADWEDAAEAIYEWYSMTNEEREKCGFKGREFCLDPNVGLNATEMCRRMINDMVLAINTHKPRKRFSMHKITPFVDVKKPTGISLKYKG